MKHLVISVYCDICQLAKFKFADMSEITKKRELLVQRNEYDLQYATPRLSNTISAQLQVSQKKN